MCGIIHINVINRNYVSVGNSAFVRKQETMTVPLGEVMKKGVQKC